MTIASIAAESTANSLLDRLMLLESGEHDDLELRRIVQEANKLVQAGGYLAGQGYGILGAVASYQLNAEMVESYFTKAVMLSDPENIITYQLNRAIALHRLYMQSRAVEHILEAIEAHRDSIALIEEGVRLSEASLQFETLDYLTNLLSKLEANKPAGLRITEKDKQLFISKRDELGITSAQIMERLEAAGQVLLSQQARFGFVRLFVLPTGECSYQFHAKVSSEKAAELTFMITDRLVECFDDALENLISISVFPFEATAERHRDAA